MLIAGEPSGDQLAAELVAALRAELSVRFPGRGLQFFGAGGPKMAAAGVELAIDLTQHSVIGLIEVLKNYRKFKRIFDDLLIVAKERKPDVVIGVDYGGFNLRFAKALRQRGDRAKAPKLVQYVSPQVWASRAGRAATIAETHDLLLTIFPFEKPWYAARHPSLTVEFVGHPAVDRYAGCRMPDAGSRQQHRVVLLPGSRRSELKRHLPVMLPAAKELREKTGCELVMVLPGEDLAAQAKPLVDTAHCPMETNIGGLADELRRADLAIASTGTVTMECAFFGVPTVALYKTSWSTYQIGKRIVTVKYLAMPNILADEIVFPEFVQDDATPDNIAAAALELLRNQTRRTAVRETLSKIVASLGEPGAASRAAKTVAGLISHISVSGGNASKVKE
jgi:lipid-A-disaccharide synthase